MLIHKTISTHSSRPASGQEARREGYETVMPILEYNTGGKQRATSMTSLCQIVQQNGVSAPKKRFPVAIENGDVVAYGNRLVQARADELRAALKAEDAYDQPARAKMRMLAEALAEVDR